MTGPKDEACEPDLDRLAEDWIALWQGEMAGVATDPEVAAAWRHAIGLGAAWLRAAGNARDDAGTAAPRPATAGDAPCPRPGDGLGGEELVALRARIEELERRLAALERGAGRGGADRGGARRRRPPA